MTLADLRSELLAMLLPPAAPMLCAALGCVVRRRHRIAGRLLIAAAALLLYLPSTPFVAALLMLPLQTGSALSDAIPANAEAVVVLGGDVRSHAAEYGGDTAGSLTLERIRYAAALQRRTGLPLLVSGGPILSGGSPIAIVMRNVLIHEYGVPVRWVEAQSRDTWENAGRSAAILQGQGITRILLVTHAWHMRRALLAFAAAGLDASPAPTGLVSLPEDPLVALLPTARAMLASAYAVHEWIGVLWYELRARRGG
jgi:uncharacterized SAM-binding protein YcdF (DUF218 family)